MKKAARNKDNTPLTLFDDFERTSHERANHDSSSYTFLNNSAWRSANYIRKFIIEWSKDFTIDKDFVKRFRSKKNKEHQAAFFEFVMFQFLKRHNLHVVFQDTSISDSKRRPDFTLYKNDEKLFIAECTLSPSPHNDEGRERLKNQITDILESIPSPKYWVSIHFMESSTRTLAKKHIAEFIKNMISEGQPEPAFLSNHKRWPLKKAGWHIDFCLYPKTISTQRTLGGISNGPMKPVDSKRPLRSSLNTKRASNYGTLELPFVICINSSDPFLDELSIYQTLFGNGNEEAYFYCNGKPQNQTVAAILIFKNLAPWNLNAVKMSLWHNPWAMYPLSKDSLLIDNVFHRSDDLSFTELKRTLIKGRSLAEILSIDPMYLDEPLG